MMKFNVNFSLFFVYVWLRSSSPLSLHWCDFSDEPSRRVSQQKFKPHKKISPYEKIVNIVTSKTGVLTKIR